jgi:6-phosphogluconolactonase (cycloisomerase 2 family)
MIRAITTACIGASFCAAVVFGQPSADRSNPDVPNGGSTDAYVYVSATIGNTNQVQVYAFAAARSGKLTPVQGSPFDDNITFMAVNGLYLFGSDASGTYIHAYSIDPNGALRYAASTNVVQPKNGCDSAGALFFDHEGATLYNVDYYGADCADTVYQAFAVQKSSGKLTLVNEAAVGINGTILRFAGNNRFAYGADCGRSNPAVYGYLRGSDGSLTRLEARFPLPTSAPDQAWCPYLAAADPANHVAVAVRPSYAASDPGGPYQLATYTHDEHGRLITTSTNANMPRVAVGEISDMHMSPSGKVLAVAGTNGLQIFHFNGVDPITPFATLLAKQDVDQMFWDNNEHLYAISQSAGKLWVFNVSSTAFAPAPGSPYSISGAQNIVVQPWPLPWSNSEARVASPANRSSVAGVISLGPR